MKTHRLTLIGITLLTTLILGAGAVLMLSRAQTEVGAGVTWDPKSFLWDSAPTPWNAEVSLKGGHKAQVEIDPTSIRLEGQLVTLYAAPYNATHGPRLIIPFYGDDVKAAVATKLPHFFPGKYRIPVTVSGTLKAEYASLPWSGDGVIVVTIP